MKKYKYIGEFRANEGNVFYLEVYCFGFFQAFL
jgi:hypothetical protein